MNLYVFRHGETYFSKNNLPYGDKVKTAEMLPEGIPAVERLARYLKNIPTDANFSSPFKRCRKTSEIVQQITGKEFTFDERLQDWIPEEESVPDVIRRATDFAKEIENRNCKSVAICTHGYPINALVAYFTKGFVREADLENFPKPGVLVSVKNKKASFKNFS